MKDLHCHLLPGLDDGARTPADTAAMLKRAAASGIDTIAATSHYTPEGDCRYDEVFTAAAAAADACGIRLLPGMEYDLTDIADLAGKKLRQLGDTGCLLVDMNCDYIVRSMVNLFFELKLAGYRIIFAHPERLLGPADLLELLQLLAENDIYVQLDSGSLLGCYGALARQNAFAALDRGGCHFLWNDAHHDGQFVHDDCRALMEKRYGRGLFELLTEENPAALLAGGDIQPSPRRRTFWERLRRQE